jgi:hypothetical protein
MTGAPAGGALLTITGRGFSNLQLPPAVWVGLVQAMGVEILSNAVITCRVPPGLGRNLEFRVTPRARMFPRRPILEEDGHFEIAEKTVHLSTGFSYDGTCAAVACQSTFDMKSSVFWKHLPAAVSKDC